MSVNKVILVGNLTRDPEAKYLPDGKSISNFSIATSESWKGKDGEKQEKAEFHNCVAFGGLAEVINTYLKKGSKIYVEGKLETDKYEKDGSTRYSTKIVVKEMTMLGGKDKGESSEPAQKPASPAKAGFADFDSDEIPFAPHGKCGAGVSWRAL